MSAIERAPLSPTQWRHSDMCFIKNFCVLVSSVPQPGKPPKPLGTSPQTQTRLSRPQQFKNCHISVHAALYHNVFCLPPMLHNPTRVPVLQASDTAASGRKAKPRPAPLCILSPPLCRHVFVCQIQSDIVLKKQNKTIITAFSVPARNSRSCRHILNVLEVRFSAHQ